MEKRGLGGDAEYWGYDFRYPSTEGLFVPAAGPQKFAVTSAYQREAASYKADGSAAQIVRFPGTIRYALFPEQNLCDAAIGRAGVIRSDRAKGRA